MRSLKDTAAAIVTWSLAGFVVGLAILLVVVVFAAVAQRVWG